MTVRRMTDWLEKRVVLLWYFTCRITKRSVFLLPPADEVCMSSSAERAVFVDVLWIKIRGGICQIRTTWNFKFLKFQVLSFSPASLCQHGVPWHKPRYPKNTADVSFFLAPWALLCSTGSTPTRCNKGQGRSGQYAGRASRRYLSAPVASQCAKDCRQGLRRRNHHFISLAVTFLPFFLTAPFLGTLLLLKKLLLSAFLRAF
jgi:hypothetical protein